MLINLEPIASSSCHMLKMTLFISKGISQLTWLNLQPASKKLLRMTRKMDRINKNDIISRLSPKIRSIAKLQFQILTGRSMGGWYALLLRWRMWLWFGISILVRRYMSSKLLIIILEISTWLCFIHWTRTTCKYQGTRQWSYRYQPNRLSQWVRLHSWLEV